MFRDNSRYSRVKQDDVELSDGRTVTVVRLRRLPATTGSGMMVKGNDQLDLMAQRKYGDPTWFWHIADANTELQANDLVKKTGRTIQVPET